MGIFIYKVPLRDVPGGMAQELKNSAQHLPEEANNIPVHIVRYHKIPVPRTVTPLLWSWDQRSNG